jgi:hypothetical protein
MKRVTDEVTRRVKVREDLFIYQTYEGRGLCDREGNILTRSGTVHGDKVLIPGTIPAKKVPVAEWKMPVNNAQYCGCAGQMGISCPECRGGIVL